MDQTRPWYKKKRFLIPIAFLAGGLIPVALNNSSQTQVQSVQQNAVVQQQSIPTNNASVVPLPEQVIPPVVQQEPQPTLSNDSSYQNVDENNIHSPAYTSDNSVPAGASAQCGDGSYSYSQHRSGTCSHHGGVAIWY